MKQEKKYLYYSLGDVKNFGIDTSSWTPNSKIILIDGSFVLTPLTVGEEKHKLKKFEHSIIPIFVAKGVRFHRERGELRKEYWSVERWVKARIDSKYIKDIQLTGVIYTGDVKIEVPDGLIVSSKAHH